MKTRIHNSILIATLLCSVTPALAAVPDVVTYAGTLQQGSSPANGTFSAVFEIFDAETDGARVFTQAEPTLAVTGGELVVDLGDDPANPLSDNLLASGDLFLAITINGEELSPRVPLSSVPFSRRAQVAERAEDADTVDGLSADEIAVAGAGLTKAGNTFSLAPDGVTSENILDGTIQSNDLSTGAVTSAAIADLAITAGDIKPGAIGHDQLGSQSVAANNLQKDSVTTVQIANGQVQEADLGVGAVGNTRLAPNAVTSDKIADGSVHTADIGAAQVTAAKVSGRPVLQELNVCGGNLRPMIFTLTGIALPQFCNTISCGTRSTSVGSLPTYLNCDGTCGATVPATCSVPTTSVGVLVTN